MGLWLIFTAFVNLHPPPFLSHYFVFHSTADFHFWWSPTLPILGLAVSAAVRLYRLFLNYLLISISIVYMFAPFGYSAAETALLRTSFVCYWLSCSSRSLAELSTLSILWSLLSIQFSTRSLFSSCIKHCNFTFFTYFSRYNLPLLIYRARKWSEIETPLLMFTYFRK